MERSVEKGGTKLTRSDVVFRASTPSASAAFYSSYYFLLFLTVFDVVCDWKPLATAGMEGGRNSRPVCGLCI
jgi:hypothetical protein